MDKNTRFGGILPALACPSDDNDRFLEDLFAKIITSVWQSDIDGLYVCGATGDAYKMRLDERKRAAQIAVDLSREHDGTVIIHVGASNSRDAMELAEHAADIGASAISSMPMIVGGHDQVVSYYTDIARATQLPVFVYHVPILTGRYSSLDELLQLVDIPGVVGLKYTDWNLFLMKQLLLARPEISIFNGFDELLLAGLLYGAHGGIGTHYNLFPQLFVEIFRNFKSGRIDRAMELQNLLLDFSNIAWKNNVPAVFQSFMRERGLAPHCFRRPSPQVGPNSFESIEPELSKRIAAIDEATGK